MNIGKEHGKRSPIKLGGLKNNELIGELSDRSIKTPKFLGRVISRVKTREGVSRQSLPTNSGI